MNRTSSTVDYQNGLVNEPLDEDLHQVIAHFSVIEDDSGTKSRRQKNKN